MAQKKTGTRSKKKPAAPARGNTQRRPIRREVWGAVCLVLGVFTFIGYFVQDYWLIDGLCLYVFKGLFGWGFYVVPFCFFIAGGILFFHRGLPVRGRLIALAMIPLLFGAMVHLFAGTEISGFDGISIRSLYMNGKNMVSGGVLSGLLAYALKKAVSIYGAAPALMIALIVMVFITARLSLRKIVQDLRSRKRMVYEPDPLPEPEPIPARAMAGSNRGRKGRTVPPTEIYEGLDEDPVAALARRSRRPEPAPEPARPQRRKTRAIDIPMDEEPIPEDIPPMPTILPKPRDNKPRDTKPFVPDGDRRGLEKKKAEPTIEEENPFIIDQTIPEKPAPKPNGGKTPAKDAPAATAKPSEVTEAAGEIEKEISESKGSAAYRYPPVDLLQPGKGMTSDGRDEVMLNRERLETTLRSFGIGASVSDITRGPTVTRYDLELEAGVKLNKITNLAGDLALSLGVVSVRIAPIPDKISTVGVEVPNKVVSTVYLRDIIESSAFQNAKSKLSFSVGKDIGGNSIVGNISKMPHMLIAGTTGSGKSVCMNCLILSLLYKATPEEVRLIMIDPKMVELGIYNGIPHLYIPVVTDPKKAAGALQWSVVEMMKRYRLFSEVGVRDINGYNGYLKRNGLPTVPNVVIVIDELADLMMTAAKEVEESVCRVAQMGRAAGIHLIIATQRPSADVITGLMKANIPSRIAFAVSSALESRIILDQQGAEKLIGMGDMLYAPLGCGKPLRIQGAFVSDEERERVIDFVKKDAQANYNDEILNAIEIAANKDKNESGGGSGDSGSASGGDSDNPFSEYDELLPQAVEVILDTKQASVSMLQRRLKLGYSRAARLVDQMEEIGVVGPFEGSKPRQLLVTREQWQEMSMTGNTPVEQLINQQKDDFSRGGDA